jgi:hypothetical protein
MAQTVAHAYVTTATAAAFDTLDGASIIDIRYGQTLAVMPDGSYVLVGPDNDDPCEWVRHALPDGQWVCVFESVFGQLVTLITPA